MPRRKLLPKGILPIFLALTRLCTFSGRAQPLDGIIAAKVLYRLRYRCFLSHSLMFLWRQYCPILNLDFGHWEERFICID